MIEEDKVALSRLRADLVESLAAPLSNEDRVRVQGELSVINARIKALNTTEAARLKALADRRRVAGLAEAQSNAARAAIKGPGSWPSSAPGEPGYGDPINKQSVADRAGTPGDDNEDDDPGQTAAIDGWIDAVLVRHDVDFTRGRVDGALTIDAPPKWDAVLGALIDGIYAAARGQELPPLPREAPRPARASKSKKR
jgi:hypothetical protein